LISTRFRAALAAVPLALAFTQAAHAVSSTDDPAGRVLNPGAFGGAFDGVAKLLFSNSSGNFVCSGSLLSGGQYVLTAAHCADDFTSMTVDFKLGSEVRTAAAAYVHSGWNGTLDTGADIAIIKLSSKVTDIQGFNLSSTNDVGKNVLLAGYGLVGQGLNGATGFDRDPPGTVPRIWRPHFGYNTIDATGKQLDDLLFGPGAGDNTYGENYVYDFDDGTYERNGLQRLKDDFGAPWADSSAGLGADEALIAGGDSGGGDFVWNGTEWLLTGVHSWGWGVCGEIYADCDTSPGTNSSFGDFSGSTAVFSHTTWISSVTAVPEPETYALMLLGLGVVGTIARRRKAAAQ
jgi:hypothetical protein